MARSCALEFCKQNRVHMHARRITNGLMIFSCFPAVIKLPWVGKLPNTPYLAVMTLQRVSVLTVMAAAMWQGPLAVVEAGSAKTGLVCLQGSVEDGNTVVVSTQGPLCFANAQRIKERVLEFGVSPPLPVESSHSLDLYNILTLLAELLVRLVGERGVLCSIACIAHSVS